MEQVRVYWSVRFAAFDVVSFYGKATAALVAANGDEPFSIYTNCNNFHGRYVGPAISNDYEYIAPLFFSKWQGAAAKTRLESRIKKLSPHCVYRLFTPGGVHIQTGQYVMNYSIALLFQNGAKNLV